MPLYDYHCNHCRKNYEELRGFDEREGGKCRHCGQEALERKIVRFRIGKQGDLRETTEYHGCHRAIDGPHDHDHGHVHGPGCGHGSGSESSAESSSGGDAPAGGSGAT